jgi:Ca2+-binding RTX toxin-like protein
VNGGGGNDKLVVGTLAGTSLQRVTFDGGNGDDALDGSAADRALVAHGGSGADVLHGGSAADTLLGEEDNDILIGGHGNDLLDGGAGADQLIWTAGDGSDRIIGGIDADTLQIEGGTQTSDVFLLTSAGGDVLLTSAGASDALDVSEVETIKISGLGGDDVLSIGDLSATAATKVSFDAGSGDDILDGSQATTAISANGEGGNDTLIGGAGNDSVDGGGGYDVVLGGGGADTLIGGTGDDHLDGGTGADSLVGGTGDDTLDGGDGADTIVGGPGEDLLWGGAGPDAFTYASGELTNGVREGELILDYSAAQGDTVHLPHGASDVVGASAVNGNLVVTLAGDGDTIEFAGVHHLSDVLFV